MHGQLKDVITRIRNYPGVLRKQPIRPVVDLLSQTLRYGDQLPNYGDDAAIIPWGDEYLLVAADGMMTGLLINEPYAAGKASVMVTVNDIYSMGGRPIGMVNVLASGDDTQRRLIVEGIEKGCRKLQVPMLGGHLHPDSPVDCPALSVTIIGRAKKMLRSHLAAAGDRLVLAVDLDGRAGCRSVVSWDANSGKSPKALRCRLEALPLVAESGAALRPRMSAMPGFWVPLPSCSKIRVKVRTSISMRYHAPILLLSNNGSFVFKASDLSFQFRRKTSTRFARYSPNAVSRRL